MEAVFLQLLNMSISAGYLVLIVVLLRLLLKKAPKFIRCILWGFVGIRLVLPISWESVLSLIPSTQTVPSDILYAKEPAIQSGIPIVNNVINPIISDSLAPDVGNSVNPMQVVVILAANIWIAGMVVMALYAVISYLRLRYRLREAAPLRENIWVCDRIESPFLLGIFRPRIYLPSSLPEHDTGYVIAHERAHLRRKDHWWKPIGFLLLTAYWFNPLMWIAYILLCRDIELACDEKVIRQLGEGSKKPYSEALINCSVPRKMISACPVAFGEEGVKGRIKSILNYKKPAFWIILVAVIVCIAVAVFFLSNPPAPEPQMPSYIFDATVLEINGGSMLVAPLEGETETATSDKFRIHLVPDGVAVGDTVRIWYDGMIQELYPSILPNVDHVAIIDYADQLANLRRLYPEYFDLSTSNGLDVYVWAFAAGSYHCGLVSGRNMAYSMEDVLDLRSASLEDMALILSTYDIPRENITVVLTQHPLSSYAFLSDEIPAHEAYIKWALGLSDGPKVDPPDFGGGILMTYPAVIYFKNTDVDHDGIMETCSLSYGPTSGIFTFTMSIHEKGELEYFNIFHSEYLSLGLERTDNGQLLVTGTTQGENPVHHIFTVTIQDGNIVLTEDGVTLPYWGEQGVDSIYATNKDTGSAFFESGIIAVSTWSLCQGEFAPVDVTTLPHVDYTTHEGSIFINNVEYIMWSVPAGKWEWWVESGWRINVNALSSFGKATSGEIVYASGENAPIVVCLYNDTSNTVKCLLKKDFSEKDFLSLKPDCFTFLSSKPDIIDSKMQEYIWQLHTTPVAYDSCGVLLDGGNYTSYTLIARHNACPALLYELNYQIYETGEIHIQNLPSGTVIHVKSN